MRGVSPLLCGSWFMQAWGGAAGIVYPRVLSLSGDGSGDGWKVRIKENCVFKENHVLHGQTGQRVAQSQPLAKGTWFYFAH